MKALLLAAGYGKRLGELTRETPKPLIRVGDEPILAFCLNQLLSAGITEVIVNAHYLAPQIESFLENFNTSLDVHYSFEENLLGTAGTLRKHIDRLSDDDFVVMHSDNYFSDTLQRFVVDHKNRKNGVYGTMATFESQNPEECGVVVLNPDKTIREFHEKVKHPPTNLANGAIYLFTPEVRTPLLALTQEENDISKNLIPVIMNDLRTFKFEGLFVDIGTPEGLKLASDYKGEFKRSNTD